jgi:ABC-type uncharacterized transport system substrate-binding protein
MMHPRIARFAATLLLLAASVTTLAQSVPRVYRIGFVSPTVPGPTLDAFRAGLREVGYVEGGNALIEARFAEGRPERLPALVADVIRLNVDVLVVGSTLGALAAKRATTTVPIVFAGLIDPVAPGVVASLARPGGNVTGATFGVGGAGIAEKWVELLKESVPDAQRFAVLWNSANPGAALLPNMEAAARELHVRLDLLDAGTAEKLAAALEKIGASRPDGVIVTNDPFFFSNRKELVKFAAIKRLPVIYFTRDFVDAGGLMSYGSSVADSYRRAARYVDKILKGAKPGDVPIDQPTRFELVVNQKAARALGLAVPRAVLTRADEIVD